MGKYAHYFHNGDQQVFDMDFYERAHNELSKEFPGFEFAGAIQDKRNDEEKEKLGPISKVIRNVGKLNRTEFEHEFGQSKLMIGIGAPTLSPSPFQALAKVSIGCYSDRLRLVFSRRSQSRFDLTPGRAVCQSAQAPRWWHQRR